MEVRFSPAFDAQRRVFSFCFTCETCAHFDDALGECLHGFPNAFHRLAHYDAAVKPAVIVFCKDFDLA